MVEINTVKEAIEQEEAIFRKHIKLQRKNKSSASINGDDDQGDTPTGAEAVKEELVAPSPQALSPTGVESKTVDEVAATDLSDDRGERGRARIDAPHHNMLERDPLEKENPTVDLVDTATGRPLDGVTAIHVDVGRKRSRTTTQFQSITSEQPTQQSNDEVATRDAYQGMVDELRHASLAGSGVHLTRREGKPPLKNKQSPMRVEKSSQPRLPVKLSSPSPPQGFMTKVPSMRSSASAISELSIDPSDPFNQALDDISDWRLNTGYASENSSFHMEGLRAPGPDAKARGEALLPVHIINLVVEDTSDHIVLPPDSARTHKVAPKKPFRLQLTPNLQNLHFGGHRIHEHDLQDSEAITSLAEDLPGFYTELQDAVIQGRNPRHWSIPTMPSILPEDPPLLAKARQNKNERLAMIRRTERLLERLDAEKNTKRADKKKAREAKQLRDAARRKEEEDVGIFEDLDVDDDEDTAIVVVHEDENDIADDGSDSGDDDSDRANPRPKVIDILNAMTGKESSWTDSKSHSGKMRTDFVCSLVERYRVSSI